MTLVIQLAAEAITPGSRIGLLADGRPCKGFGVHVEVSQEALRDDPDRVIREWFMPALLHIQSELEARYGPRADSASK